VSKTNTISEKITFPLLFLLVVIVHSSGLFGQLLGDDHAFIANNNQTLGNLKNIPEFFKKGLWDHSDLGIRDTIMYRPVSLVFGSISYLIAGTNPFYLHVIGFLMHFINALLVARLIGSLYPATTHTDRLLGASFFAVHPALAGTVAWISGQSDIILTTLFLSGFLFYLRYRKEKKILDFVLTMICFILALFSKETSVLLPFLFIACDLIRIKDWKALHFGTYSFFIVSLAFYFAIRSIVLTGMITGENQLNFSAYTFGRLFDYILFSVKTLIIPWPLPYFTRHIPGGISNIIEITIGLLVMTGAVFAAFRFKNIRFPLIWIFATLLPPLSLAFVDNGIFALRFLYLPCIGVAIIFSLSIVHLKLVIYKTTLMVSPVLIILCFSILSIMDIGNWKTSDAWAKKIIRFDPGYSAGWIMLAEYYEQTGDRIKAQGTYQKGLQKVEGIKSRVILAEKLGEIYATSNRGEESLKLFRWISQQKGFEARGYLGIGNNYLIARNHLKAMDAYRKALIFNPYDFSILYNLGMLYETKNDRKEATRLYMNALKAAGKNTDNNAIAHVKNFLANTHQ